MAFHPDSNLPGCMMPDGGDCCAGHAAVCEDWHKQRRQIDALVAALKGYEQWEADIILENKCWTGQNIQLTDELYERMIQLQTERNRCFHFVESPPDTSGNRKSEA